MALISYPKTQLSTSIKDSEANLTDIYAEPLSQPDIYFIHDTIDERYKTNRIVKALRYLKVNVWYNDFDSKISINDSMRMSIWKSKTIAIFVSKNLLKKIESDPCGYIYRTEWYNYDLRQREHNQSNILIPIWDREVGESNIKKTGINTSLQQIAIVAGKDYKNYDECAKKIKEKFESIVKP